MTQIIYQSIGTVESPVEEPLPPEDIRKLESRLVLEPQYTRAAAALEAGQYLWVIYHLHRARVRPDSGAGDIFTRRIAVRPNPVGITLVRVVAVEGEIITVSGLDALNGSPLLDIKPYKEVFDTPQFV